MKRRTTSCNIYRNYESCSGDILTEYWCSGSSRKSDTKDCNDYEVDYPDRDYYCTSVACPTRTSQNCAYCAYSTSTTTTTTTTMIGETTTTTTTTTTGTSTTSTTTTTTTIPGIYCDEDDDCPRCYQKCNLSINRCYDFRTRIAGSCKYYDWCDRGYEPGHYGEGGYECSIDNGGYGDHCSNVDQDLCDNEYYGCHVIWSC